MILDQDGNPIPEAPKPGEPDNLVDAMKVLNQHLTQLCEQIAHPRLAALGIPEWTARCWAHKLASNKSAPMLVVHAKVTAGAPPIAEGRDPVNVAQEHHGMFEMKELALPGGGERLVMLAVELVGMVIARAMNDLVDAGVLPPPEQVEVVDQAPDYGDPEAAPSEAP